MQIQQMFERDIDRYINGVVSVGEENTIKQELEEYVVTRELQRHFGDFFEAYERGLDNPARNVGVWIQGYFGSGKSHFLKMLSYLLENRAVAGRRAVDYFDGKFDDPMTYARIRRAAGVTAETILFNIDEKGGGYKEGDTSQTAVLRSIARVFYEHLGFYGRDYKLARFEKMIDDRGKTEEFRAAYEEITGNPWIEDRENYDIFGEEVAQAANRAVGMSVKSVTDWADNTDAVTVDFGELVEDINEYALKRERECGGQFRLLFMIDEMGQYLNGDVNRMLNLQTFVEKFCDTCGGRVWMVVTSQEAIDEMMNVVSMDFSKIQGRFSTRLSLSSSSVDEVIKKRVLEKNHSAKLLLKDEYGKSSAILKNLFTFEDSRGDLRGYATETEFVESFPFVGYQFTLMPSVLKEIRKHGYQGKSLSTGERSMLSSYQEAAQSVENKGSKSLVPFWRFYDTLEKELDHGVKQVFERARQAAYGDGGLRPEDLEVLKTLYLINYITDVKPVVGNIAILLIDAMDVDKVALRERVKESLDRLVRENYVSRNGERYAFLTDEEQDVAREIREVQVDPSQIVADIQSIVYSKVFTSRKYRRGANDFPVDRYVDDAIFGNSQSGMKLNLITLANAQLADAGDQELSLKSSDQALVVLDTANDYYDVLYNAAKIKKYVQTQNVAQLPETKRRIVEARQREATANRNEAEGLICEAIVKARTFVNGAQIQVPVASAIQKFEGVLNALVDTTFTKAALIDAPIENDAQLRDILLGHFQSTTDGRDANEGAAEAFKAFLESRARMHQNTTMGDVQRHFQARPFGWREIDIAAVAARLVAQQWAEITYGGQRVAPSDAKMKDYLRKQSEIDKATIKMRKALDANLLKRAKDVLREIDGTIDIPNDEDGLVKAVRDCMKGRIERFNGVLNARFRGVASPYPGRELIENAVHLASAVLEQQADSEALLRELTKRGDDILDNVDDLGDVERFFNTGQIELFDAAVRIDNLMRSENVYIEGNAAVQQNLAAMRGILADPKPYRRIKDLPALGRTVEEAYNRQVDAKRHAQLDRLAELAEEIERYAQTEGERVAKPEAAKSVVNAAQMEAARKRDAIHGATTCSALDAVAAQLTAWHAAQLKKVDNAMAEAIRPSVQPVDADVPPVKPHVPRITVLDRNAALPVRTLRSEAEIDAYLAELKGKLMAGLEQGDGVRL